MLLDRDPAPLEPAPDQLQAAGDRLVEVHPIDGGLVEPGEPAQVLHDVRRPA